MSLVASQRSDRKHPDRKKGLSPAAQVLIGIKCEQRERERSTKSSYPDYVFHIHDTSDFRVTKLSFLSFYKEDFKSYYAFFFKESSISYKMKYCEKHI